MKAKYFTAENCEAATAIATDYFGCDKEDITFELVDNGLGSGSCLLLAIVGLPSKIANMDAHCSLYFEDDGVYLELYKQRGAGYLFESSELKSYLNRKRIKNLDIENVEHLIKKTFGRVKVAAAQDEYTIGEDITITISDDGMQAAATLLAPEPGGLPLSVEDAKDRLTNAGVVFGIDTEILTTLLTAKLYGAEKAVAFASPPENGEDGKLIFHFSTDERTGSPMETIGGRVDYRTLDLYVPVEEGQLLVTREHATEGSPGMSVTGSIINQKPGKEIMFPRGKNVDINDEKTEMHASCSGMVEYVNNSVYVSSVYDIKSDCDLRVGNIDFDGSVHIHGNVCTGSVVKATGSVIIEGSIEAATIIAGGNVEVKGGMQGADKGLIEAGGAVTALYVERGRVHADGHVKLDMCIHSIVEAGETLTLEGRRGAIIGGRASSFGDIVANYVGALSNTRTEVAVGVTPRKRERLALIKSDINKLMLEQIKLNQLDSYLSNAQGVIDAKKWDILYRSSVENRKANNEMLLELSAEKDALEHELENATDSMVHVFNTMFPGSRVLIGQSTYVVKEDISYASFKHKDNEVIYVPCELKKTS
ncbi:MAG: FapA family protein [Oscillospiraceae bacterium]|nr:FapA family protein [Oscillospiraceae bacterium]